MNNNTEVLNRTIKELQSNTPTIEDWNSDRFKKEREFEKEQFNLRGKRYKYINLNGVDVELKNCSESIKLAFASF